MEFMLDIPFIRDILEREHALVRDETRDFGVLGGLESSHRRRSMIWSPENPTGIRS
jgi:hypothetical protein